MESHCRFPTYPFLSTSALRLLSYFSLCPPSDIRHLPSNSHGRAMMMVVALKYPTFHYKGPNVECTGILLTFFVDLHPTFGSTFPEFPKCNRMRCHCPGSQRTPLVSIRHQIGLLFLVALDVFPFYTFPFVSSLLFSVPFLFILFLLFALLCLAYLSFLFLSRTKGDDGGSTPQIPHFSLPMPKCGRCWNFTYFFLGPPSDLWIHLSRVPQVQAHALPLS